MSMLTPLGSGGHRPSRRRRSRWLAAVLVTLVLLAAGVGAWWWFTQRDSPDSAAAGPTVVCVTPTPAVPPKLPAPAEVSVSVLNGTDRAGLAIDTADTLVTRGFDVVAIGNAPNPVPAGVAVVVFGPKASASAVQLSSYFPGATLRRVDDRRSQIVQVNLGPAFTRVATPAQARKQARSITLPALPPRCRTVRPTPSGS